MDRGFRSPRWVLAVVRRLLPDQAYEVVSGDLAERFRRALARDGVLPAQTRLAVDGVRSVWQVRTGSSRAGVPYRPLAGLGADLRMALRMLLRQPLLGASAILVLGLGIGIATVGFAVLHGTALRGLPFEQADRLVHLERARPAEGIHTLAVAPGDFAYWREHQTTMVDLAAYVEALFVLTGQEGETEQLWGAAVSAGAFDLLGVTPMLGRTFSPEEDRPGADDVVLLGHEVWRARFGADPGILERELRINGRPTRVVGVMPPGFAFPLSERIWRPLALDLDDFAPGEGRLDAFGRMRPGITMEQARTDLERLGADLAVAYPESHDGIVPALSTFTEEYVGAEFTAQVWTMQAASLLVLVLAGVNVANLLAARAAGRSREFSVRSAIGAGRWRLLRQQLVEGLLLAVLAAGLATVVAAGGLRLFELHWAGSAVFSLPHGAEAPFWWSFGIDPQAALFIAAATLSVGVLVSVVPGLESLRRAGGALAAREAGAIRSSVLTRRLLVLAQVAVCTGLLVAAGLVVSSARNLREVGRDLPAEGVVSLGLHLPSATVFSGGVSRAPTTAPYPDDAARLSHWERVEREVGLLPTVRRAAIATDLPVDGSRSIQIRLSAGDERELRARVASVTPGFFAILGADPIRGRSIESSDTAGSEPIVVVNESFARSHWPDRDPIGRRLALGGPDSPVSWLTVVGVVPDLWMDGVAGDDPAGLYLPLAQASSADSGIRLGRLGLRYVDLLVDLPGSGGGLREVRATLSTLEPGMPVTSVRSFAEVVAGRTARFRRLGSFYLVLGTVAFVLAFLGLYGVMADQVASRTPEFGTRMALGASPGHLLRMVFRQGAVQVAAGVLPGLWLAGWLQPELVPILYRVEPWDPRVLAATLLVLAVAGWLACLGPARRATRVDPVEAIRSS